MFTILIKFFFFSFLTGHSKCFIRSKVLRELMHHDPGHNPIKFNGFHYENLSMQWIVLSIYIPGSENKGIYQLLYNY